MKIKGFKNLLPEPQDLRGAQTLIEGFIPMPREFHFIIITSDKPIETSKVLDAAGKPTKKEYTYEDGAKFFIVGVGAEVTSCLRCGDTIYPGPGFLGTAIDIDYKDMKIGIQRETHVKGIFVPSS